MQHKKFTVSQKGIRLFAGIYFASRKKLKDKGSRQEMPGQLWQ